MGADRRLPSQDLDGDWVAELACGHSQHMRHRPPWQSRPWVADEAGRAAKLGAAIDCPLCDMPELPAAAREYKRTTTFIEATTPAALLRDHRTKPGVWARIVIRERATEVHAPLSRRTFVLLPTAPESFPRRRGTR